jgi:hypothetical protein
MIGLELKELPDEVGQQEADREDDEQPKQEAEMLMGLNEAYHANTLLAVSSMLMAWDKRPGPLLFGVHGC